MITTWKQYDDRMSRWITLQALFHQGCPEEMVMAWWAYSFY